MSEPKNELNQLYNLLSEILQSKTPETPSSETQVAETPKSEIPPPVESSSRIHPILMNMFIDAESRGASDIFISVGFPPAMKINGILTPVPYRALNAEDTVAIVKSTMNSTQLLDFNKNLEINYSVISHSNTRYRVNAYHEQGRMGLVLRRINQVIPTIDELGLPSKLKELALTPRGLLLIAGPTGSGKTTSLAAMLNYRNQNIPGHIVTIEDPIEYIYKPNRCIITQREIGDDTQSWKIAVQSALRQAPDVVCVNEVRNEDSMEYALQLAQTGHLCLFTIHANNAPQAIERILNFYPEERHQQVLMDLALNLVGIIGQRLAIKKEGGRTAVVDLLLNTPAVQDLVFKGQLMEIKDTMVHSTNDGMQTFDQNLFDLYVKGVITYDEALRQADSTNDLSLRIQLYEDGEKSEQIYDRINDLNLM